MSAIEVAEYFLYKAQQDEELISNMKLQKLLYYAQGFHLAIFDQPLFSDEIERWTHGPAVTSVYRKYKKHRARPIAYPKDFQLEVIDKKVADLLDEVYEVYGQFSAGALRNMTHKDPPWLETDPGDAISLDLMKKHFKTLIK